MLFRSGEAGEKAALALLRAQHDWLDRGTSNDAYPVISRHARSQPHIELPFTTDGGPMGFYGLPLDKPGLWLVELDSARFRASRKPEQRPAASRASLVQVTNLNITVRASQRGESLVWVTALDTGKPAPDVELAYYDCSDTVLWRGRTRDDGTATLAMNAEIGRAHV